MPSVLQPDGFDGWRSTEQFLDLVCADEDLLRAGFDAIIAAEWPTSPIGPTRERRRSLPPLRPGRAARGGEDTREGEDTRGR